MPAKFIDIRGRQRPSDDPIHETKKEVAHIKLDIKEDQIHGGHKPYISNRERPHPATYRKGLF